MRNKKRKGKKGSEPPPTALAGKPPEFLGTLRTPECGPGERGPGAEAEESYGITSGYQDWYSDFQSSDSDSVDSSRPAERPSLVLASLHGSTTGEEPAGRFWGGPAYGPGTDSAESYGDQPDYENLHSEADSAGSLKWVRGSHRPPNQRGAIPHRRVGLRPSRSLKDRPGFLPAYLDSLTVLYVVLYLSLAPCLFPSLQPPLCLCLSVCPSLCLLSWSFPLCCSRWPVSGRSVLWLRHSELASGPWPDKLGRWESRR
ncbi:hypothetical protein P4O66_003200 [Electrophorus voltai]|uniref:Uncharacterized protein n=1 Tax=Electrophorus voltai TaxID=2609070 RepID=A0AAD8YU81_9TELE|nr:hypothetical protein P4O66_003200 [Electrophorus voltai]